MPPHNLSRGDADIVAGLKYGTRFRAIRQDNRPLRSAPVRKPANASNTGLGSSRVSTRLRGSDGITSSAGASEDWSADGFEKLSAK